MKKVLVLLTLMSLALPACRSNSTTLTSEPALPSATATSEPTPLSATATSEPATPTLEPTLSPATAVPAPELGLETLKNAEYHSEVMRKFQLVDGIYYLTPLPGESPDDWYIKLASPVAFGDVNGDGTNDAVVTLVSRSGGTGAWPCLAVVINQEGRALNVATQCLGDRDRISAVEINDNVITAHVVIHGPNDAACCPSLETTWRYRLVGTELLKDEQ